MPALSGGMILYSSLSAKSVACNKLKVLGVSAFFFFPVLVAALTRADEFHSVTKTRWPPALSHFASSPSWVVFPDPSMPSTTNSLPGYSCGCVSVFNMTVLSRFRSIPAGLCEHAADLNPQRFSDQPFERFGLPLRRPHLELRVTGRPHLQQAVVAPVVEVDARDRLAV